jgi:copper chaperone CopZ
MAMQKTALMLIGLFLLSGTVLAEPHEVLEIDVAGMTCAFCAYGVEKNLGKLPGVEKVQVSLEAKKARVVMKAGETPDETIIRDIIRDAGFTPRESSSYTEET